MSTDPDDTDLRHSAADDRHSGFDPDGRDESYAPPRFGRLALCIAAAGALTFGVVGTVAYGVWFNEDQQTYAEAIAGAREALGSSASSGVPKVSVAHASDEATAPSTAPPPAQPAAPEAALEGTGPAGSSDDTSPASWSGQIHPNSADPSPATTLADTSVDPSVNTSVDTSADTPAAPTVPTPAQRSTRHTANAAGSSAQAAAGHGAKDTRLAQQERRAAPKHKGTLFARIGQFFRRVSYRQHDNGRQQQDPYSHP
jgi:hypothetical protein